MENVTGTARSLMRIQDTPTTQGSGLWSVGQVVNSEGVPQATVTLTNKYGDGKIGLTLLPSEAEAFAAALLAATTAPLRCSYCGKLIVDSAPGGRRAEYCSQAHRQAAYRERNAQRAPEQQPPVGEEAWRYQSLDPAWTTETGAVPDYERVDPAWTTPTEGSGR
jgi:hypothetical protein